MLMRSQKFVRFFVLICYVKATVCCAQMDATVVEPATGAADVPFKVVVTKVEGDRKDLRRIAVEGTKSVGTRVSVWLDLRNDEGRRLTVGMYLDERADGPADQPISWRSGLTVDVRTAEEFEIGLYIHPEGVAFNGGTRYRIPLGKWVAPERPE